VKTGVYLKLFFLQKPELPTLNGAIYTSTRELNPSIPQIASIHLRTSPLPLDPRSYTTPSAPTASAKPKPQSNPNTTSFLRFCINRNPPIGRATTHRLDRQDMLGAAGLIRLLIRALAKIGNWRRWCPAPRRISSSLLVLSVGFGADGGRGEEIGVMLGFFV
jgi:hypothetical protein